MLTQPHINPILLKIGPLKVHWYGVMYLFGFAAGWILGLIRAKRSNGLWSKEDVSDMLFFCIVALIIGGRLGYMLFYSLPSFFADPLSIFKVWQGGMSFHGGFIGALIGMWIFAKRNNKTFFEVGDFMAPLFPLGLAAGRFGNFINGELWGKVTSLPWGMVFPNADNLPRHPSQLYELGLEGLLLFLIVWIFSAKPRPKMAVSGVFCVCYGLFRFFVEFVRVPDPQYGYLAWNWLTMGQVLTLPLIMWGGIILTLAYTRKREKNYV